MTGSGDSPRRAGSGCVTAIGVLLILVGGLALAVNLGGLGLLFRVLELAPVVAVWWPALLVIWGVWKLVTRLRSGSARFGFLEVLILILIVLCGSALSLVHRTIAGRDLQFRFTEIGRWARDQAAPLPQHSFVTERVVALPEGAVEVRLDLPAGGILVREIAAAAAAPEARDAAGSAAGDPGAEPETAGGAAGPAPARVARFTLTTRVRAEDAEAAAARAGKIRLETGDPGREGAAIPVRVRDSGESDAALDLVAALPPGVRVAAVSGRGAVRVEGAFDQVSARTSDGPLEVTGAMGEVSLAARDGNIRVVGTRGPLDIRARRAPVEVETVAGAVIVEADAAPVWIEGAGGEVTVRAQAGSVGVFGAAGPVEVTTRIAPIDVREVSRGARLESDYGPVRAAGVRGPVLVRTDSATVEVRDAGSEVDLAGGSGILILEGAAGPVTVTSGTGEVLARDLAGPATFTATGGTLTLREFTGPLVVEGGDADLEVGAGAVNGLLSLTTGAGDIRLELPAAGSFSITAEAEELDSDFALEREAGARRWAGSVGEGAAEVRIVTRDGDAVIRAAGPGEGS